MLKILYVTTISNTVNAFLIPHINMLIEQGHQVDVAFNIVQDVDPEIINMGCKVHQIEFQRSPINIKNVVAYKKLKDLITSEEYDLVHTHTPTASAIVRLACKNIGKAKVIYTAHGFHFYKGAPIQNWLIYYPIEKWLSKYTDVLLTINKEDFGRAKKSFNARVVDYIPGVGFDTNKFCEAIVDKLEKRCELNLPVNSFLMLSVGELNKNKNHETIIKALAKLNNPNIYYVICGEGPMKNYLSEIAIRLGVENQVKLLGFRKDIADICMVSDLFMFPSHREGLGMAALEAMASGLPVISSNVHGINDYSIDGKTGFSCSPEDVNGFAEKILKVVTDLGLRDKMGNYNRQVVKKYDIKYSTMILNNIYKENFNI